VLNILYQDYTCVCTSKYQDQNISRIPYCYSHDDIRAYR